MSSLDKPQVPALEQWAMEFAALLAPSLEGIDRARIAVGLIQARATECKQQGGELYMKSPGIVDPGMKRLVLNLAVQWGDRHEKLEKFAMEMADRWIKSEEAPKVVQ